MSIDPRTPTEREADSARINQRVAEDVAVGMAVKADAQEQRADVNAVAADLNAIEAERQAGRANLYAVQNTQQAQHIDKTRRERDEAIYEGAVARDQASRSRFVTYLILSVVGASLVLGLLWFLSRRPDTSAATLPETTRTTTTTTLQAPPAPTPATVVVPVPVPVPVVVPKTTVRVAPAPAVAPTLRTDTVVAPPALPRSAGGALPGYVEPAATSDTAAPANSANPPAVPDTTAPAGPTTTTSGDAAPNGGTGGGSETPK